VGEASVQGTSTEPVEALTAASIRILLNTVSQPALLLSDGGRVLAANHAATARRDGIPSLPAGDGWQSSLPGWIRCLRLYCTDGRTVFLVVANDSEVPLEECHRTAWARRWALPPRLARVAAKMADGLSDKEIASELGLSLNTVRTYARRLFEAAGVHSRTELTRAIHARD